jgi:broad specificity phosphatase PhoE
MRLILIRHGQTPSNVAGLLDTRIPGPGLTELGFEQAAAIPAALAGERIDALYCSVQVRTQLTIAPLAESTGLVPLIRAGIREVESGDYEMLGDADSVRAYMDAVIAWAAGDGDRRLAGGETGAEVFARYNAVIAEAHAAGHQSVAFVSHGAVIRSWVGGNATNVSATYVAEHWLANTGIVILDGDPVSGWTALSWMGEDLDRTVADSPATKS